jgi:hypothetical protein
MPEGSTTTGVAATLKLPSAPIAGPRRRAGEQPDEKRSTQEVDKDTAYDDLTA